MGISKAESRLKTKLELILSWHYNVRWFRLIQGAKWNLTRVERKPERTQSRKGGCGCNDHRVKETSSHRRQVAPRGLQRPEPGVPLSSRRKPACQYLGLSAVKLWTSQTVRGEGAGKATAFHISPDCTFPSTHDPEAASQTPPAWQLLRSHYYNQTLDNWLIKRIHYGSWFWSTGTCAWPSDEIALCGVSGWWNPTTDLVIQGANQSNQVS